MVSNLKIDYETNENIDEYEKDSEKSVSEIELEYFN